MSSMQQDLLSMPFCEGAASAQGQYVPSMSSQPPSARSSDCHLESVAAAADRAPVDGNPVGVHSIYRAPDDCAPVNRAPIGRAEMTHLQEQMAVSMGGASGEHRCPEQPVPAAAQAAEGDDEDSEQSGVFDQSPAAAKHNTVMHAIPQQVHGSAGAQHALTAADDHHQASTATAASVAAAMTEPSHSQAVLNMVEGAARHAADSTRGQAGRCTKGKVRAKPRAPLTGHGAKESVGAGLRKPASRTTGLPKGHSSTAALPSTANTAHTVDKLHRGKVSQACQPRRSAKGGSAVLPPGAATGSASATMSKAAASSPRLAVKKATAVLPTGGIEPPRPASAPANASSRSVSCTAGGASPRAAAASSRVASMSPRATAQSPRSPSPTHRLVARGRPPFVTTIRSGIPEPSSAGLSPRPPRPVCLSPERMGINHPAVMPQAVHTAQKAVLAHQSQLELMLDANSNAV
ncbi:hypothetical protein MMC16_007845, partial [Acarospora aff. strigata]|nr:hypothetical protein [Acarospora aff. strigata]